MKIILASRNRKKTEEIRRILEGTGVSLVNLDSFPSCPDVEEDGETFQANAEKKARQVAAFTGLPALADDSGLVVDALGGAPGVYSARYAGLNASDADNLEKLLLALRDIVENRTARFECVLSLAHPDGRVRNVGGSVAGHIIASPRGENGFGYDPVFVPDDLDQTFAEMPAQQKDAMSHRGRALTALTKVLHGPIENLFLS